MLSFLLAGILCLTFDDSGWENWVRAMPLFERYHAHATFFPSGALSTNALACLMSIEKAGHTVGSHSLHHRDATTYFEEVSGTMYCREDTYYGELNHYGMYWLKWADVRGRRN